MTTKAIITLLFEFGYVLIFGIMGAASFLLHIPKDKGMDLFEKNYHNRVERAILEHISDDIKEVLWNKVSREDLLSSIYSQKMTIYDLNDWSRRVSYPL